MATYGYTFSSGDTVTPTRLNSARTFSDIVNADISASAAISKSKLSLTGEIVNADINASAAIDLSKLGTGALPSAITVSSTNLVDGTIVDADINASAAIAHTKLASITAGRVLLGNASNVPTATELTGDVTVTSSGVTAIGASKIVTSSVNDAAITAPKLSGAQTGSAPIFGCRAWVSFDGTFTAVTSNSYSRSGTTVTVTKTSHGLSTGNRLAISAATDSGLNTANATTASAEITVTDANTFTFQTASTGTASGTLTYARGIRGAGNVSSVERTATGVYLITFTTAMPDTNYALAGFAGQENVNAGRIVSQNNTFSPSTSSCEVRTSNSGNAAETNVPFVSVIFIR